MANTTPISPATQFVNNWKDIMRQARDTEKTAWEVFYLANKKILNGNKYNPTNFGRLQGKLEGLKHGLIVLLTLIRTRTTLRTSMYGKEYFTQDDTKLFKSYGKRALHLYMDSTVRYSYQIKQLEAAYTKVEEILKKHREDVLQVVEIDCGRASITEACNFVNPIRQALYNPVWYNIHWFGDEIAKADRLRL